MDRKVAGGRPPKLRDLFVGVALLVGSVLFVLVVFEVILRLTTQREVMRYFFMSPDAVLNHKFIPHATGRYETVEFNTLYEINSLGLRDKEYSLTKSDSSFRILMLGDSFTEGDGMEQRETILGV